MKPSPFLRMIYYLIIFILCDNVVGLIFGYHDRKTEIVAHARVISFALYVALLEWISNKQDTPDD